MTDYDEIERLENECRSLAKERDEAHTLILKAEAEISHLRAQREITVEFLKLLEQHTASTGSPHASVMCTNELTRMASVAAKIIKE